MLSDAELIARVVVEGDRNSYSELIQRYQSSLRGFFLKLAGGDQALADDLSQETFISAYKGLSSFKGHAKFSTWLFSIGKNVFLQNARKHHETPMDPVILSESEGSQGGSEILRSAQDDKRAQDDERAQDYGRRMDIHRALKELDSDDRLVLGLCYVQELTHPEVAEILQIPLGTVKTNVLRAKEKLKLKLLSYQGSAQ
ncbi:MAG: sigma-70 family RNA polymerase sigma factor [Bdellovibrionales bacterium]|nr:sigma-70 family RNA polymerase sigma factor [Bdellovibrionales bacterium]